MLQQPSRDEWRWGSAVRGGRRSAARGTASVEYAASRTRPASCAPTDGTTDAWTIGGASGAAGSVLGCPGRPWRSRRAVLRAPTKPVKIQPYHESCARAVVLPRVLAAFVVLLRPGLGS